MYDYILCVMRQRYKQNNNIFNNIDYKLCKPHTTYIIYLRCNTLKPSY